VCIASRNMVILQMLFQGIRLYVITMRNPGRETTFRFRQFSVENRRSAMKVGTDGVLLGAWAELPPAFDVDRVRPLLLDVGAGTGLISLMLAQRFPSAEISAVEIDGESAC
ncbi:MAG: methyltransferase, partial [Muribaculaceae bacterium]|nr:methyltransferase [Muribaculaceae bacterium]